MNMVRTMNMVMSRGWFTLHDYEYGYEYEYEYDYT